MPQKRTYKGAQVIAIIIAILLLCVAGFCAYLLIHNQQQKAEQKEMFATIELIDSLILQRQALKISQRELASAAGVSWTEVALMEQKKHMVQLRALLRIAAALNCKLVAVSVE